VSKLTIIETKWSDSNNSGHLLQILFFQKDSYSYTLAHPQEGPALWGCDSCPNVLKCSLSSTGNLKSEYAYKFSNEQSIHTTIFFSSNSLLYFLLLTTLMGMVLINTTTKCPSVCQRPAAYCLKFM
jgi:hypothetical protein